MGSVWFNTGWGKIHEYLHLAVFKYYFLSICVLQLQNSYIVFKKQLQLQNSYINLCFTVTCL